MESTAHAHPHEHHELPASGGALTALCVYFWIKAAAADYERLPRER